MAMFQRSYLFQAAMIVSIRVKSPECKGSENSYQGFTNPPPKVQDSSWNFKVSMMKTNNQPTWKLLLQKLGKTKEGDFFLILQMENHGLEIF